MYDFFEIGCQCRNGIFWMLQEGEVMDCDNIVEFLTERRQSKVGAMINIHLPCEIGGIERQAPAIPEDVQVAVGDEDAAPSNVGSSGKRTLPCGASACKQGILVTGILGKHGTHQVTHIVPDACLLPDTCCIVNRNMHENILRVLILAANQTCVHRAGESADERRTVRHLGRCLSRYGSLADPNPA